MDAFGVKLVVVLADCEIYRPVAPTRMHVDLHLPKMERLAFLNAFLFQRREAFQVVRLYFTDMPRARGLWQTKDFGIQIPTDMTVAEINADLPPVWAIINDFTPDHAKVLNPACFLKVTSFKDA